MSINDHFQSIVFDIDGTVFDTLPSLVAAINDVLNSHGLTAAHAGQLRAALSEGLGPLFRQAHAMQGKKAEHIPVADFEAACHTRYLNHWLLQAPPYPGVGDALAAFRAAGFKLGVCTNRDPGSTAALLCAAELSDVFDVVVALGDAPLPKPSPAPLLLAMSRLGSTPDETVLVGDSVMDCVCAHGAQVPFAAHLPGYAPNVSDLQPHAFSFTTYAQLGAWVLGASHAQPESSHV